VSKGSKRKAENAMEFRRRRAVELIQQGESKELVCRILGVSRVSINIWLKKIKAGETLETKHGPGRARRLNSQQLVELEQLLQKGAPAYGWENNFWTTKRVRKVIEDHFGIKYCRSGAWHVLRDYLHWSAIRPAQQAAKRDEVEIARWKAEEFPRIERQAIENNAHLAFVDESGFMMTPTIRRTFAPCGSTPVNKVFNPHGRISVCGAIVVSPTRSYVGLHYYMLEDDTNFRGPRVVDFLKHLQNQVAGPITIVWDQIIIHSSNVVLEHLATASNITTEPFPPYAPELNPVDRAWFYLKYGRLPNFAPPTMDKLRHAVDSELKRLQKQPGLLCSFIRQSNLPIALKNRRSPHTD
jgi:transposase